MKSQQKLENFYLTSLFIVKNQPCLPIIVDKDAGISLKIIPDDTQSISLGFLSQKGLVRLRPNGSVDEENLLGTFISIVNEASEVKRANLYKAFFERNGYINSIIPGNSLTITLDELDNKNRLLGQLLALTTKLSQGNRLNVDETISIILRLLFNRNGDPSPHKLNIAILNSASFLSMQKRKTMDETGKITIFDTAKNNDVTIDSEFYYDFLHFYKHDI